MTGGLPEPARLQAREAVEVARRGLSVAGVDRNRARSETRTVVVVSPDARLRQRLASSLAGLRWWVREASGGAQAMMLLGEQGAEAMVVDHWLPDLEVGEFAEQARLLYPEMDLLTAGWRARRRVERSLGRGRTGSKGGEPAAKRVAVCDARGPRPGVRCAAIRR